MAKLSDYPALPALPAQDVDRLRSFYEDRLGFTLVEKAPDGSCTFEAGKGSKFGVFPSTGKASGEHTQLMFDVDDVDSVVSDLKARGVTFEQYDMPGFKTDENGIVEKGDGRGAWFKDPEGNLIAVGERS